MALHSPLINVMVGAARKAARGLKRDFGEVEQLQVSMKGPADFVSTADLRAEEVLHAELARVRPNFGFLMEESAPIEGRDKNSRWIVDPLDGTTNFLHGLPHFAISIALEQNGELVAGVIYEPIHDELFFAEKGQGAFVNDQRLRVAARRDLSQSLISTGIPFAGRPGHDVFLAELGSVTEKVAGVRRWGTASLDLAYLAAGRYDGFWERGLKPWDMAAGIVLIREAGGFVNDLDGGQDMLGTGSVLASNVHLLPQLTDLLARSRST